MGSAIHKIGIISDTHGLLRDTVKEKLRGCDAILHAGDIGPQKIIDELNGIAKTYAVRGNTDKGLSEHIPSTLRLHLYGLHIYMIHNKKQITEDITDCDLIIYGHSHKYDAKNDNGQTWLNPGSCGHKRFTLPLTMAVLTLQEDGTFQIEKTELQSNAAASDAASLSQRDIKDIIIAVMKDTDKKHPVADIAKRNHISEELAAQICRLYLTHPGVSADGILNKMGY